MSAMRGDRFARTRQARGPISRTRSRFLTCKATGEHEDFMTGFVVSDTEVWGRPVGVAVANDGSLLVTEDGSGTIWRITYQATVQSR